LKYYRALKSFGAPVDFIREDADFSAYPVIVVPAYQQMSLELIRKLTQYAENGGNLVISCRTGHQNELGHLWEARHAEPIFELIGSEINFYDLPQSFDPGTVEMDGNQYSWNSWGDILQPAAGTESWASYQGDFYAGESAVTFHWLKEGSVTYVGADSQKGDLELAVLKKVYDRLGIPVENYPPGILVEYRDGFGIAMNYGDTPYTMKLPEQTEILIGKELIPTAGILVWKIK
jgi:beta-galactosidase